jgi:predicted nucleic acid-binding protein
LIYLDASVALAQLLAEDVHPSESFWSTGPFVASRLLQYEVWTRIHSMDLASTHGEDVDQLLAGLDFLELAPSVLARALEPFPVRVRTLDALHLASMDFMRARGQRVHLATYDRRLADAAAALDFPLADLAAGTP